MKLSDELFEILNTSFFGNTQEMYSRLLEENFINLSADEKLNYLFKNNIIQDIITKNYMLVIIILLLVSGLILLLKVVFLLKGHSS